jgi:thioredoxin 1
VSGQGILTLTEENFDEQVAKSQVPILVDFWASWCGPCKMVAPTLEAVADELDGQVHIGKVDVEANGDLATRFAIRSIPTLILFKDGKIVDQLIGAAPKGQILTMLQKHLV